MSVVQQLSSRPLSDDPFPRSSPRSPRLILIRAVIWGIIGLVYAPLFIGLSAVLQELGLGSSAYIAAAAIAGGAGALLYGARDVALVGTGVGLIVGAALLIAAPAWGSFETSVLLAAVVAALVAASPAFPSRCGRHAPAKALAGVAAGAVGGTVLAIAEPCHPSPFSCFAVVAFLTSVNGVLYVAGAPRMVRLVAARLAHARPCNLVESAVVALLAGLSAGSIWVMAGPLLHDPAPWLVPVGEQLYAKLPYGMLGGIFGGAVAGALLQVFGFRWVHDL
jgi:hypothetical protein